MDEYSYICSEIYKNWNFGHSYNESKNANRNLETIHKELAEKKKNLGNAPN